MPVTEAIGPGGAVEMVRTKPWRNVPDRVASHGQCVALLEFYLLLSFFCASILCKGVSMPRSVQEPVVLPGERSGFSGQAPDGAKSAGASRNLFTASPPFQNAAPWSGAGVRCDAQPVEEGRVLPCSPLGTVLGVAALILLYRSWFRTV